jgi:hypothetical protein
MTEPHRTSRGHIEDQGTPAVNVFAAGGVSE